jgi:hypothetical protein
MAGVAVEILPDELRESILLNLPIIDLITTKRINSNWNSTVFGSTKLQQNLFQQPIPASQSPAIQRYTDFSVQPVWVNPLLQNVFRIRHSETTCSSIVMLPAGEGRKIRQTKVFENVLERAADPNYIEDYAERRMLVVSDSFYQPVDQRLETLYPEWPDPGEERSNWNTFYMMKNWADMLATQPPLQSLSLRCDHMGQALGRIKVEASNGEGITLCDIAEAAAEFYRQKGKHHWDNIVVDMSIYQRLDVTSTGNIVQFYDEDGVFRHGRVAVHRAWKTKLRCQLG